MYWSKNIYEAAKEEAVSQLNEVEKGNGAMKGCLGVVGTWLLCGFFAWGIVLADLRHQNQGFNSTDCRHDQAFSCLWGLAFGPVSLLASLGVTGFAEHGVQWTCTSPREGKP